MSTETLKLEFWFHSVEQARLDAAEKKKKEEQASRSGASQNQRQGHRGQDTAAGRASGHQRQPAISAAEMMEYQNIYGQQAVSAWQQQQRQQQQQVYRDRQQQYHHNHHNPFRYQGQVQWQHGWNY